MNSDADLYISVMDGRFPTEEDYDYMSDLIGTDFIRISSTDNIFTQGGSASSWDPKVGIMIVIGVYSRTENIDYSLTVNGPQ